MTSEVLLRQASTLRSKNSHGAPGDEHAAIDSYRRSRHELIGTIRVTLHETDAQCGKSSLGGARKKLGLQLDRHRHKLKGRDRQARIQSHRWEKKETGERNLYGLFWFLHCLFYGEVLGVHHVSYVLGGQVGIR